MYTDTAAVLPLKNDIENLYTIFILGLVDLQGGKE
jgi:hypothetical protein